VHRNRLRAWKVVKSTISLDSDNSSCWRHVTADELQSLLQSLSLSLSGGWLNTFFLSLYFLFFMCLQLHLVVNCIMHIYGRASQLETRLLLSRSTQQDVDPCPDSEQCGSLAYINALSAECVSVSVTDENVDVDDDGGWV